MNKNMKSQLETVEKVFSATHAALETMTEGQRMQLKDLVQLVSLSLAKAPKEVFEFVKSFAQNTDVAYITRGAKGGVVKGTKPVKVVKVKTASVVEEKPAV